MAVGSCAGTREAQQAFALFLIPPSSSSVSCLMEVAAAQSFAFVTDPVKVEQGCALASCFVGGAGFGRNAVVRKMGATVGAFASAPFGTVREGIGRAHGRGLAGLSCIIIRYRRVSHYLKLVEAKELGVAGCCGGTALQKSNPSYPSFLLLSHQKFPSPPERRHRTSTDRPTDPSKPSLIWRCHHKSVRACVHHGINHQTFC